MGDSTVTTLSPAPDWYLSKLAPPQAPAQQLTLDSPPAPASAPPDSRARAWALAALQNETRRLEATTKGSRTSALNAIAYRLFRIQSAGLLEEQEIETALIDACKVNGLLKDKGVEKVVVSIAGGMVAGQAEGPPALPDFTSTGGGNGKLTTPPQPAQPDNELERLRRFAQDTGRILATGWKPTTKITALYLELRKLDGDEQLLDIPAQEVARNIKISPTTANNSIRQLSLGGLVERRIETVLMDAQRREVNPRQVDPRDAAYHWEGQSTLIAPPLPEELPEELPKTAYDSSQAEKSAENLRRLRWAATRLQELTCPCCGEKGLHVVCTACGTTVEGEKGS
jgi:ribosomal protein L32